MFSLVLVLALALALAITIGIAIKILLSYYLIGCFFLFFVFCNKDKDLPKEEKTVFISLFLSLIFAPIWPAFLLILVVTLLSERNLKI
jgi:hypothetical protein